MCIILKLFIFKIYLFIIICYFFKDKWGMFFDYAIWRL